MILNCKTLVVVLLLALQVLVGARAQEGRDPTAPPPEIMGAAGSAPGAAAKAGSGALGADGGTVIVRDGKPFLVVGTRLFAPGQKVGHALIERITETEVWLREAKVLRKIPRFAGIQRSVAAPVTRSIPSCQPHASKVKKSVKKSRNTPEVKISSARASSAPEVAACDHAPP